MTTVAAAIAAYHEAAAAGDTVRATKALERLEDEAFRNESDWATIRRFCEAHGLDGRLEIITQRLIRAGSFSTGEPFFAMVSLLVKSDRIAEARAVADAYKKFTDATVSDPWEFINLLFKVEYFRESLDLVQTILKTNPDYFPCRIMETRIYWKLGQARTARMKLKSLRSLLNRDEPGNWVWFASIATELQEFKAAREVLIKLVGMIEAGSALITNDVAHALNLAGLNLELRTLVKTAKPQTYKTVDELIYILETATLFGYYETALNFGNAIMALDPGNKLAPRIKQLSEKKDFLMS
jgi:tetratricopeptide (TPR) repeat protein